MLQRLPIFLKENNAKFLIKYDGERSIKKYTIRVLYNDIRRNSLGNDTDSPSSLLYDLFKDNDFFNVEDMLDYFFSIINIGIEKLKNRFGKDCVISTLITENDEGILYTLHIQTEGGTIHLSDTNYKQLCDTVVFKY